MEILLNKNKSVGSRNVVNDIPLDVVSTSKPIIRKDLKEVVDLFETYREEYAKCSKYRVTLTIKPYCTNLLFNVCTEVVKDEGSSNSKWVNDSNSTTSVSNGKVYGEYSELTRHYMVSNTEYSSPEIGYSYYPGYDMLDNHTLRNLSFRSILFLNNNNLLSMRERFNTIDDCMRTKNGDIIYTYPRFSYEDVESDRYVPMHIYNHDNLLSFIDGSSAEANLRIENGWCGFTNASSISEVNSNDNDNRKEHVYSHTINNVGNCEFIDMFPDRTRYSFIPKYNEFEHRYEKNWDIFLTYPWKNVYNHNLVNNVKKMKSGEWNVNGDKKTYALATLRVFRTRVSTNRDTMLFRTFCHHNLAINDKVGVYLSKDYGVSYTRLPGEYTVDYVGDENGENEKYFFGISSKAFLNNVFAGEIENLFYGVLRTTTPPITIVNLSEGINDVPDVYNALEVIRVFKYTQERAVQTEYSSDETFDVLPKTVNEYSSVNIRVWDGTYTYYEWVGSMTDYIITSINPQVDYGEWNTYTDKPTEQGALYIRVKNYSFYVKTQTDYRMTTGIDIDSVINEQFSEEGWNIRFVKVVNGVDCDYYIRQFRKIPNLKFSREPLPDNIEKNEDGFLKFVEENASNEDGHMLSFDSETYNLAFSKTLYGDDVAQVTFLDTVETSNLTDNLGRPVTEIYSTVVKRNKGYREWYENGVTDPQEVEYSRCFGSLITGLEYLDLRDKFDETEVIRELKGNMSSVGSLYRDRTTLVNNDNTMSLEDWDSSNETKEITETDDVFYGDVVEYNPIKCEETVLADACFRFNTAQREIGRDGEDEDFNLVYNELSYDDFDPDLGRTIAFQITQYSAWSIPTETQDEYYYEQDTRNNTVRRKEGYFYKPHTKIQLLRFSNTINQGSHKTLRIKECVPLQADKMYIKITTNTAHGIGAGTVLYVCNGDDWMKTSVAYVIDKYRFAMSIIPKDVYLREGTGYLDWIEVCKGVNSGLIKIRVKNNDIPSYASKVDENIFLWRDIINPVNLNDNDVLKHPFSNNCFYVDSQINVYLRRQDPDAINGLYYSGAIGDRQGKIRTEGNNEYKEEGEMSC